MSRRLSRPKEPASIGDYAVEQACNAINVLCQRTVTTMVEYEHTRDYMVRALFSPDTLERAARARGIISPGYHSASYIVGPTVSLYLNFEGLIWPTIIPDATEHQPTMDALITFVGRARAIYEQFEEMKGVLRWLNRNATLGAVRYYWPTAMSLCPEAFRDMQHVPSRYSHPPRIGDWMNLLRDTASTYARAQMLPGDAQPRQYEKGMRLTFSTCPLKRENVTIETDQIVFNL